jgi:hypothetical protein
VQLVDEPLGLLSAGEFRAAILIAHSLFEVTLRDVLSRKLDQMTEAQRRDLLGPIDGRSRRIVSVDELVRLAVRLGVLGADTVKGFADWRASRNRIAHFGLEVSPDEFTDMVKGLIRATSEARSSA